MHPVFSIEESLRFGWAKTREHSGLLFQVLLALFALQVVSAMVRSTLEGTLLGALAALALAGLGIFISTGLAVIALKLARGEHAEFRDIIPPSELVLGVFLASLLAGILVLAGLILLIIPGIYFMLRFAVVKFAVIDGASVTESFDRSTELTRGVKWPLLGFLLIIILINIIGALLFMVGLLVTVPVSMIAYAHVYLKLKSHHHGKHAPHAE